MTFVHRRGGVRAARVQGVTMGESTNVGRGLPHAGDVDAVAADGPLPAETSPAWPTVRGAVQEWIKALLDLSGNNQLLYAKSAGKLDLASADKVALNRLVEGKRVRLRELFPEEEDFAAAAKTAGRIRKRAREYEEELGVQIARLTSGLVSWPEPHSGSARVPNAPLFLRTVVITQPQAGVDDLELAASADVEVNEVLIALLEREFHVRLSREILEEIAELAEHGFFPGKAATVAFKAAVRDVAGLDITDSLMIGTFRYRKLPMVQDLAANAMLFAESDLVAAVAGNVEAIGRVRLPVGDVSRTDPNHVPPNDEFLVLDADPSQNYAINAALAGRNIVIQGPPGTGKSQTIANLIAATVARGKSVLFVAEKRAAIDAVTGRLADVGLAGVVMDLHDGASNKGRITAELSDSITASGAVGVPEVADIHRRLGASREQLLEYDRQLHTRREPWGVSVFDAQTLTYSPYRGIADGIRLSEGAGSALTAEAAQRVRDQLREAGRLGGFLPLASRGAWATASDLREDDVQRAFDCALQVSQDYLPGAMAAYGDLEGPLPWPSTLDEWTRRLALLRCVAETNSTWEQAIWDIDLGSLVRATAPGRVRRSNGWTVSWAERRSARKTAKALLAIPVSRRGLHDALVTALAARDEWRSESAETIPAAPDLSRVEASHAALVDALTNLAGFTQRENLPGVPLPELSDWAHDLARDPAEVMKTQRINEITRGLHEAGLDGVLAVLHSHGQDWTVEQAGEAAVTIFDHVWATAILHAVSMNDPVMGRFDGARHSLTAQDYATSDRKHLLTTPARILRSHAENLVSVRNLHPEQSTMLEIELRKKRRIKAARDLFAVAPDVMLAAKPCWAMSPLVVSEALPADAKFDLVVFDEASQIEPADAIPALGRAETAVVCGDAKQLPPWRGFQQSAASDEEAWDFTEETEEQSTTTLGALTTDTESLLDVFDSALGASMASEYRLLWHYRSRDARLIAFNNEYFYNGSLLTFPGTAVESPLEFVSVPHPVGRPQNVAEEVGTVVDLILRHARERSSESLGVIAMSIEHARRIEGALDARLREESDPAVRSFFNESAEEPFFIKNLERVQGDERDAIIISMGYIKNPDGRMVYRFGPINNAGGERRLNVAFSRAKDRLTLVSSFTAEDLDPTRLSGDGGRVLRAYLQYVASGGSDLGERGTSDRPLNPFEIHVRDRLQAAGVPVIAQYGVAGYWIDFAATHPEVPGRMVLAIEADGATYHSSDTARARDRLRQEHLERLGWTFHRIWSTDYFRDPDRVIEQTVVAYRDAVERSERIPAGRQEHPVARHQETAAPAAARSRTFPVRSGLPISEYSDRQLLDVIAWVMSDMLVRTDEEILSETMECLGFKRRGSRIAERLTEALRRWHAHSDPAAS